MARPSSDSVSSSQLLRRDFGEKISGQTRSLVSISGPIEARLASESPSQATLDIHIRPLTTVPGTDAKALAATLKSLLSPSLILSYHPRTLIQVVGQALCGNESGSGLGSVGRGWNASLVASLINATSAALISAGSIPMKGVVCAVAVGRLSSHISGASRLVLDPSETELGYLAGGGCFAFLFSTVLLEESSQADSNSPACLLIWTSYSSSASSFDESELFAAKALAEVGARQVWHTLKDSVPTLDSSGATQTHDRYNDEERTGASRTKDEVDDAKMEI